MPTKIITPSEPFLMIFAVESENVDVYASRVELDTDETENVVTARFEPMLGHEEDESFERAISQPMRFAQVLGLERIFFVDYDLSMQIVEHLKPPSAKLLVIELMVHEQAMRFKADWIPRSPALAFDVERVG